MDLTRAELYRVLSRALPGSAAVAGADFAGWRQAGVLVPLVYRDALPHILFTLRSQGMPTHKGQISFPGGGWKAEDVDLRATALRETFEEVGLGADQVEVLGALDVVPTHASTFLITPFVGLGSDGCEVTADPREVAAVLEVPLTWLLDAANRLADPQTGLWRYVWRGHEIWGATARILSQLLRILGLVDPFAEDVRLLGQLTDSRDKLRFTELMKTFHPRGRGVAEYVRGAPSSVATPEIRRLAQAALAPAEGDVGYEGHAG
ncbi:MAG: NUDIX hydrolase [Chloroflexota bacterium]